MVGQNTAEALEQYIEILEEQYAVVRAHQDEVSKSFDPAAYQGDELREAAAAWQKELMEAGQPIRILKDEIDKLKSELRKVPVRTKEVEAAQAVVNTSSDAIRDSHVNTVEKLGILIEAATASHPLLSQATRALVLPILRGVGEYYTSFFEYLGWSAEQNEVNTLFESVEAGPSELYNDEQTLAWIKNQDAQITALLRQQSQEDTLSETDWERLLVAQLKVKAMLTLKDAAIPWEIDRQFDTSEQITDSVQGFHSKVELALADDAATLDALKDKFDVAVRLLQNPLLKIEDRKCVNADLLAVKNRIEILEQPQLYEVLLKFQREIESGNFDAEDIDEKLQIIHNAMQYVDARLQSKNSSSQNKTLLRKIRVDLEGALKEAEAEKEALDVKALKASADELEQRHTKASSLHEVDKFLAPCRQLLANPLLPAENRAQLEIIQQSLQDKYDALSVEQQKVLHKQAIALYHEIKAGPPDALSLDDKIAWVKGHNTSAALLLTSTPRPDRRDAVLITSVIQKKLMKALTPLMQERYGPAGAAREAWVQEKVETFNVHLEQIATLETKLHGTLQEQIAVLEQLLETIPLALSNPLVKTPDYETVQDNLNFKVENFTNTLEELRAKQVDAGLRQEKMSVDEYSEEEDNEREAEREESDDDSDSELKSMPQAPPYYTPTQKSNVDTPSTLGGTDVESYDDEAEETDVSLWSDDATPNSTRTTRLFSERDDTNEEKADVEEALANLEKAKSDVKEPEVTPPSPEIRIRREKAPRGLAPEITEIWDMVQSLKGAFKVNPGQSSNDAGVNAVVNYIEEHEVSNRFNIILELIDAYKEDAAARLAYLRNPFSGIQDKQVLAENIDALSKIINQDLTQMRRFITDAPSTVKLLKGATTESVATPEPTQTERTIATRQNINQEGLAAVTKALCQFIEGLEQAFYSPNHPLTNTSMESLTIVEDIIKDDNGVVSKKRIESFMDEISNAINSLLGNLKQLPTWGERDINKKALNTAKQTLQRVELQFGREHDTLLKAINPPSEQDEDTSSQTPSS